MVELRGSGFRKYRSQPQPKWKDHARLLREVQSEVEAELGEALSQARRRKAIELTLHRYMSGAIDADADADTDADADMIKLRTADADTGVIILRKTD